MLDTNKAPCKRGFLFFLFLSTTHFLLFFFLVLSSARAASSDIRIGTGTQIQKQVKSYKDLRDANVVKQGFDYSCGAASLATLMRYYFHDDVTELEILQGILSKVDDKELRKKEGFSLLDLKKYSEGRGYKAAGFKLTLAHLKQLMGPVILHITPQDYKHFVVFKGIKGDRIYLADPSRGNVRMSIDAFQEVWNGIVFVLDKGGGIMENHALKLHIKYHVQPELLGINQLMNVGHFSIDQSINN